MASVTSLGVHEPAGLRFAMAENILPPNPSPDLYNWEVYSDENGEDELFTTETCAIWSRGGEVGRCLRFDVEKEPVLKALLAYFPAGEDEVEPRTKASLSKTLVVFLRTQAHVFSFSGGDYVVHMPFEVETAIAAPRGIIIQRKSKLDTTVPVNLKFPRAPPNSFLSSQILPEISGISNHTFSTAGLGKPRPMPLRLSSTLETMWDMPLEASDSGWPRLVFLADPMLQIGLVVTQPERGESRAGSAARVPFLDPAEEILHIESIAHNHADSSSHGTDADLVLAVTVNRETSMYSVWRMTYLNYGDQFTSRRKKPRPKASRRRSSMQPGAGATTPRPASFRDNLGGTLPVKKTRKSEITEKGDASLVRALSLESDRAAEASRRQSRRASSLLARADLSASHERPLFTEQPMTAGGAAWRADSHGSQRGRVSTGPSLTGLNAPYSQTLNSLLEAPVDGLLEELRSGGDFEGFHNMGLDDPQYDGLSKEILFTKIRSVQMDTANVRYSLSNTPANKLSKVFIVAGTPYSVDEQDRNYLLICIQDTVDTRLQLLTLHIQTQRNPTSHLAEKTSITWGQLRRAQNVVDSCKIYDGDQTMILILSESNSGEHQLSIQAPWSELTTISLPPLSLHNRDLYSSDIRGEVFQHVQPNASKVLVAGVHHPRAKGVVDLIDGDGACYQVQIKLEPRTARVRQILNVLRSVLPASHAEKIVAGWWHIMQWLTPQSRSSTEALEWTGLAVELCVIFLAFLDLDDTPFDTCAADALQTPSVSGTLGSIQPWVISKAWSWTPASDNVPALGFGIDAEAQSVNDTVLSEAVRLARAYMVTPSGITAIGPSGYLPTARGLPDGIRKSSAWGTVMALHLFLEEEKLDIMVSGNDPTSSADLKAIVCQISRWLQWQSFVERYELDLDGLQVKFDTAIGQQASRLPEPDNVPCIFEWIQSRFIGRSSEKFPSLGDVYATLVQESHRDAEREEYRWDKFTPRTLMFRRFFQMSKPDDSSIKVVEAMQKCGFTASVLDSLPEGVAAPLQDAICRCQQRPPGHWGHDLYELVGRDDINNVLKADLQASHAARYTVVPPKDARYNSQTVSDIDDEANIQPMEEPESEERQVVIQALFREDKRLYEAQSLLSTSKPRVVRLNPQPNWTEPEYLEHQKELVTTIATSTLASPAGRGMLNYGFWFPLLTQKFNVQGFNLTCIVKPTNVAVGVDKSMFTEEKVNWAFFHQGVAYGLAISPRAKGIDTSWIVFNKPGADLSHRHAGFLLALGLNGHLKSVAKWVAFKYLTPKHVMTSIGLLLGLAVSHIGTMDSLITRLLSVHVTRMLPPGAAELNLSHQVQTTGIMGIGLLYYNSQHRRMSEIMMSEIEFMDDEDEEDPLRNEGYRLAAGFSLGFINLGKGSDRKGLLDMQITEQLLSLATATKKVELVNVLDRSAAAATVAIALIFMKTEDPIVARKIDVPNSILQFNYVRPDILLLRTLAKNLILWSNIGATFDWVQQSLPAEYQDRYKLDTVTSLRSVDLSFFSIVAGLCFAAALRFAGSANTRVRDMLVHYLDRFRQIMQDLPAEHFDAQTARSGARMCLDVLALSCATVMAGTGDLVVLRRLRALHGREDAHTTYGSHLAAHLAIGTLFLGSGTTTLGNSNMAVAALLVAFYPIFPTTIQDNGSHLQAFRHFWVLATEPRCLVTKDDTTGQPVSVPIIVYLKSTALSISSLAGSSEETILQRQTPCLLPPLEDILLIRTDASAYGYWDLEVNFEQRPNLRDAFQSNQSLHLRRRPPHESAFATTLQVLGAGTAVDSTVGVGSSSFAASQESDPLEWLFSLKRFSGITLAERAHMLGRLGRPEDGSSHTPSNTTDARLVLESSLDRWNRNSLLDLRLLFDWAGQRDGLRRKDHTDNLGSREKEKDTESDGVGALSQPDAQLPWPDRGDTADWWIDDSVVEALNGKAWIAGREE